jgi:hypothetical protein
LLLHLSPGSVQDWGSNPFPCVDSWIVGGFKGIRRWIGGHPGVLNGVIKKVGDAVLTLVDFSRSPSHLLPQSQSQ